MIIDYAIRPKYLPTERQVWLMSKEMEKDGLKPTMQILKAMEKGEIKYVAGKTKGDVGTLYKLCRDCLDYHTIDNFYGNKRCVLDVGYICKSCMAKRRRIKKFGTVSYISEVGMSSIINGNIGLNLQDESKENLLRRLTDNEST